MIDYHCFCIVKCLNQNDKYQRNEEMCFCCTLCAMCLFESMAGVSVYQIKDGRADVYCDGSDVVAKARIRSLDVELGRLKKAVKQGKAEIRVYADEARYHFMCNTAKGWKEIGSIECTMLSTEVVGGFTGMIIGMFAEGNGTATFSLPE